MIRFQFAGRSRLGELVASLGGVTLKFRSVICDEPALATMNPDNQFLG